MPEKWAKDDYKRYQRELYLLYVKRNLSIKEVGEALGMAESTVYERLKRTGIKVTPQLKVGYNNKRKLRNKHYSARLAEFVGVMCGDGHISEEQVWIHLGNKEIGYAEYIAKLFQDLFGCELRWHWRKRGGYLDLYIGFRELVRFLGEMGFAKDKVARQMGVPSWIFNQVVFKKAFLRGFFDTDGTIYRLRYGYQISFVNQSLPLLEGTKEILESIGYTPSRITGRSRYEKGVLYLTRYPELRKFYSEIGSRHPKKLNRMKLCLEIN